MDPVHDKGVHGPGPYFDGPGPWPRSTEGVHGPGVHVLYFPLRECGNECSGLESRQFDGILWVMLLRVQNKRILEETDGKNELDEDSDVPLGISNQIEDKPNSRLVFGCLIQTTSGVAFFDFFYPPWSLLQKKAPRFLDLSIPDFPPFWPALTAVCNSVMFTFAIKFDSIKFDVWINCRT